MVVNYNEFREYMHNWDKHPDCEFIDRCPIVNPGFPGTFNISFGEDPMLKKYGRYQHFDTPFVFSTIQQVIRHNDLFSGVIDNPEKYLGVFDMGDVHGMICLPYLADLDELHREQTISVLNLLTSLGVEKERIRPKYCAGGKVSELTNGKYNFDYTIPIDSVSLETFLGMGIPRQNIREDRTRDTLLALKLASGHIGWGYRSEIEVEQKNGSILDVATTEIMKWDPVYKEEQIIGLDCINYTAAINVAGLERLFAVHRGMNDIRDIEHLKIVHQIVPNVPQAEYIRAAHRIYSDKEKFGFKINKNRRVYLNRMLRKINLDLPKLEDVLKTNSEMQFWFPELKEGIAPTLEGIKLYRERTNER